MNISAVGFLFQDKVKGSGVKGKNYTCTIHKMNSEGNFSRNVISSPVIKTNSLDVVSPETAKEDFLDNLYSVTDKNNSSKFIGATIKDGIKETEIHSLFSDKLYAVRTKDEYGKNHFKVLSKNNTQKVLANNLYLNA